MSFVSTLVADVKKAIANPAGARKAAAAAVATALGDVTLLNTVVQHAPAPVQVVFTSVTAVLAAVVVFLTPNAP